MKVCSRVGISIVVVIREGSKVDKTKVGGKEEVDSGDVVEEVSSIIIVVVSEVEVRWTEMSMTSGDETGKS